MAVVVCFAVFVREAARAAKGDSSAATFPLGVLLPVVDTDGELFVNLDVPFACTPLVGDAEGVDWRRGEGETGDSGRRNGELRGEP